MIQKLKIQNFQAHKDTEMVFDPGVNIILGTSDSGKTSIIRALRWVIQNKPGGDSFRSHWGGETSVNVQFTDCDVTRTKGKENSYHLGEKLFTAFGQDVPKEIADMINISDTNMQGQLAAPYLLSSSSGDVSAHFNRMANLTVIDTSLQTIQKEMNVVKGEVDYHQRAIEAAEESLANFTDLEDLEIRVNKAISIEKDIALLEKDISALISSKNALISYNLNKQVYEDTLKLKKPVETALTLVEQKVEMEKGIRALEDVLDTLQSVQDKIDETYIPQGIQDKIDSALHLYTEISPIKETIRGLENSLHTVNQTTIRLSDLANEVHELKDTYAESFPDTCPLCDTILKKKK